jgi:hypothetical protein
MWKELQDSDSPEDFEDFLAAFPESKLAPVARIKLKRLKRKQAKAQAEEKQLAEEAKQLEAERKRLEMEKKQIAEAKRKAEEEQKRKLEEERKQQLAEEAKREEEERKRVEAEQRRIAEAKRKRQEELAVIRQKKEKYSDTNDSLSGSRNTEKIKDDYLAAGAKNTTPAYRVFIKKYANVPEAESWVSLARKRLSGSRNTPEKIKDDYLAAGTKNTIQGYRLFVQKYENTPQAESWVSLARKSIKGLQNPQYPFRAKTQRIKQTYDKAVKEDTTEAYERFLQQFKDDPAARFRVRLAIKKLKRLGQSNTLLGRGEYEVIIKASEDTVSCGFLSFGCEGPLQLPLFDPDFHLKHYRRVKVYANRPPWVESEIELKMEDKILILASGKVTTCRHCGPKAIDQPPHQGLTIRIGENRSFLRYYRTKAEKGSYHSFLSHRNGELQFTVLDGAYPPPHSHYADNTGSYLLDVFVYDNKNKEGFQRFLRGMIRQNPADTVFVAQAQGFLR